MARPTKYNQEIADKICEAISTSSNGLRKICDDLDLSPTTVLNWLKDQNNKEFLIQYACAREAQADFLAEEMLSIADNKDGDLVSTEYGMTGNSANVARSKLQFEARKWVASKLAPKKYGDKIELSGAMDVNFKKNISDLFPNEEEINGSTD